MAIIVTNDGDRIVANLAARNAFTAPFDGMKITVLDTTGDVFTQGGKATYQWMLTSLPGATPVTGSWLLIWKENIDGLEFVTESKTIAAGQVTATNIPQSAMIWGCTVQEVIAGETVILAEITPSVATNGVITLGTQDFNGKTLVFTYGYGKIQAVVSNILASGGITSADMALKADAATVTSALALKADASAVFTKAETTAAIEAVIDQAPGALNTLKELATALGNDANYSTTITTALAAKAPLASPTFSGAVSDADGKLRSVPQSNKTAAYTLVAGDNGKNINITTGGITIPASTFAAGDIISVYNQSGTAQNVAFTGLTCYAMGTTTAKTSPLSLAGRGGLTVMFVTATEILVSGNI